MAHIRERKGKRGISYEIFYVDPRLGRLKTATISPTSDAKQDKKRATAIRRDIENRISLHKSGIATFDLNAERSDYITIRELFDRYRSDEDRQITVSQKTLSRNALAFRHLIRILGKDLPMSELAENKMYMRHFKNTLYRERIQYYQKQKIDITENTIKNGVNRELSNIRAVINHCIGAGYLLASLAVGVEMFKIDKRLPYILDRSQLIALENTLEGEVKLAFQIIKYTLARRIEICHDRLGDSRGLKWRDINWMRKQIQLFAKGSEDVVPMHSRLLGILKQRQSDLGADYDPDVNIVSMIGDTLTRRFREGMKRIDIYERGNAVHVIRRSAATILLGETGDIKLIKELLRHKDIRTTEIYAFILDRQKQQAIELL